MGGWPGSIRRVPDANKQHRIFPVPREAGRQNNKPIDTTMNELSENEMMTAFGGSAQAVQEWGALMASSSLGFAGSMNPILWIPGSIGATIGAAAYYSGWAWSAVRSLCS